MAKINLHPNIDREVKKGVAWAVHAFTTCGIVLGFLALVSVLKNDPVAAFMWLGLALFVDGVDGTLARKARVLEYTPNVDGRTLDNVIDFFTYVAVPALMVYWFDMTPLDFFFSGQTWSLISAAAIMAVSCYTFANVGMKSDDYYFVGFPALWNVVVLYFFMLQTGPLTNLITIAFLCVLTFIPIKFVHPLRVTALARDHHADDGAVGGHVAEPHHPGQGPQPTGARWRTSSSGCGSRRASISCSFRSGAPSSRRTAESDHDGEHAA